MATFHLYEMEGVAAQLLYSFQKGDAFTAAQAARELMISQEQTLLLNLLQLAWLLSPPSDADAQAETLDPETLLNALAASVRIHELPEPIIEQTIFEPKHDPAGRLPPSAWSIWPTDWTPQMAGAMWWAVNDAVKRKHVDRAFRLSQQLLETQDSLKQFLESHGVSSFLINLLASAAPQLQYRVLLHSYGSLLAPKKTGRTFKIKQQGGRKGRLFYIAASALNTWNVVPASISRLTGEPTLVAEDTACNYWTTVWSTEGSLESDRLVFKDDTACEAFYEKHFPDDIPDEWSTEERLKSHGQSVNHEAPKNPWRQAFLLCFANA